MENGEMLEIRRGTLTFTKAVRLVDPPRRWPTYAEWIVDADITAPVGLAQSAPLTQLADAVAQVDDEMLPLRDDEDTDDERNRDGEDTANAYAGYERDTRSISVSQFPSAWIVEATASAAEPNASSVEATASAAEPTASALEATASAAEPIAKRTRVEAHTPERKTPRLEPGAPQRPERDAKRFISSAPLSQQRLYFGAGGPQPYDLEHLREQLRQKFESEMLPQIMHWIKNIKVD